MNRQLNHFTQLFLVAGFYQYLQPKYYDLKRFEFVSDWFCQPFLPFPEVVRQDVTLFFEDAYLKSFK